MDRTIAAMDQRHGERLEILSADPSNVILELDVAGGMRYRYIGFVSSDRSTMSGHWNGLNGQEAFRRMP